MNNTFDFNRFSLLVKRQWIENKKLFLMASFALFGLGVVFYSFQIDFVTGKMYPQIQIIVFSLGLFLSGTIFTNFLFKEFSDKNATTSFLQIPASHFEKLSCGLVYSFIIFPIVFILIFNVLDFTMVGIANKIANNYETLNLQEKLGRSVLLFEKFFMKSETSRTVNSDVDTNAYDILTVWFLPMSFLILGSIFYSRLSLIKTIFTGLVILFSVYLLYGFLFKILIGDLSNQLAGTRNDELMITVKSLALTAWSFIKYGLTPMLLVIAYFKLKEKQV